MIVFTTDNGGPANGFDFNYANNYPLRGVKASLWEGMITDALFSSLIPYALESIYFSKISANSNNL